MADAPLAALAFALLLSQQPPGTQVTEATRTEAAELFAAGMSAFERKDFDAAVRHFEQAHELSPHPHTRYNHALALEHSGDLPAAWRGYTEVERTSASSRDRKDAGRDRRRLEAKLAILEVYAVPRARLCLDAAPMSPVQTGQYRAAAYEGDHALVLDDHALSITLIKGHRRVLHLQGAEELWSVDAMTRDKSTMWIQGTAAGAGLLTLTFGSFAMFRRPSDTPGNGLMTTSVVMAGIAAAASVTAFVQHRKIDNARRRREKQTKSEPLGSPCPPHPALIENKRAGARP